MTFISSKGNISSFGQICIFLVRFILDNLKTFAQNRDLQLVNKYEQSQSDNCKCDIPAVRAVSEKCAACRRTSCRSCYSPEMQVCKGQCNSFMVFMIPNNTNRHKDDLLIEPSTNTSSFYDDLDTFLSNVMINRQAIMGNNDNIDGFLQNCPPAPSRPPHQSILRQPQTPAQSPVRAPLSPGTPRTPLSDTTNTPRPPPTLNNFNESITPLTAPVPVNHPRTTTASQPDTSRDPTASARQGHIDAASASQGSADNPDQLTATRPPNIPPPPPQPPAASQLASDDPPPPTLQEIINKAVIDKPDTGNFNNTFAARLDLRNFNDIFKAKTSFISKSSPYVENGKIKIFTDPSEITSDVLDLLSNSQLVCSWKNSTAIYKEEKQVMTDQLELRDALIRKQHVIYDGLKTKFDKYVSDIQVENDLFSSIGNRQGDNVDIKASKLLNNAIIEQDGLRASLVRLKDTICNLASSKLLFSPQVTNQALPKQPKSL